MWGYQIMGNVIGNIDFLKRDRFLEVLVNLVKQIAKEKSGASFAINGDWGCGKTFVLDLFQEKLQGLKDDNFFIINYNCWQYDYYEEPLFAIIANIKDCMDKTFIGSAKEEYAEKLLKVIAEVGNDVLKSKLGIDIKKAAKSLTENPDNYDEYYKFNKAISKLRDAINETAKEKNIIIIVDELDRCIPDYAIKVLERLHHISYGLENVIVIFGVDENQLNESVRKIFGENTDTKKYMKKFVDFTLQLNNGELDEDWISKNKDISFTQDEYSDIKQDNIKEIFTSFMSCFNAREQEKIITKASTMNKIIMKNKEIKKLDDFMFIFGLSYLLFKEYFYDNGGYSWLINYINQTYLNIDKNIDFYQKNKNQEALSALFVKLKTNGTAELYSGDNTKYFTNNLWGMVLYGFCILKYQDEKTMIDKIRFDSYSNHALGNGKKLNKEEMEKYKDFIMEVKTISEFV